MMKRENKIMKNKEIKLMLQQIGGFVEETHFNKKKFNYPL